jgi:hypothetical protein
LKEHSYCLQIAGQNVDSGFNDFGLWTWRDLRQTTSPTMKKNTLANNCFKGIGDLEHQLDG